MQFSKLKLLLHQTFKCKGFLLVNNKHTFKNLLEIGWTFDVYADIIFFVTSNKIARETFAFFPENFSVVAMSVLFLLENMLIVVVVGTK